MNDQYLFITLTCNWISVALTHDKMNFSKVMKLFLYDHWHRKSQTGMKMTKWKKNHTHHICNSCSDKKTRNDYIYDGSYAQMLGDRSRNAIEKP